MKNVTANSWKFGLNILEYTAKKEKNRHELRQIQTDLGPWERGASHWTPDIPSVDVIPAPYFVRRIAAMLND